MYAALHDVVQDHVLNADPADQGLAVAHMSLWPSEFNIDPSAYLYSLATVLLILALAECAYWYFTSTRMDTRSTSTHYIMCYGKFCQIYIFGR